MATPEEIRQRVEQADAVRSARRAAAAQQVGELALRWAELAVQLGEVERELGAAVAGARDVIGVDELAAFIDLKPSDLTGLLAGRKPARGRRRRAATESSPEGGSHRSSAPQASRASGNGQNPDSKSRSAVGGADVSERLMAQVS